MIRHLSKLYSCGKFVRRFGARILMYCRVHSGSALRSSFNFSHRSEFRKMSIKIFDNPNKRAILYSVLLHLGILGLLIFSLSMNHSLNPSAEVPSSIQASLISNATKSVKTSPVSKLQPSSVPLSKSLPKVETKETLKPLDTKETVNAKAIPVSESKPKPKKTLRTNEQKKLLEEALAAEESKNTHQKSVRMDQEAQKLLNEQIQAESGKLTQKSHAGRSKATQAEVDQYGALITQQVEQNWIVPQNVDNLSALLEIQLAPGGMVLSVKILKSSGNAVLDRSAVAAVNKASPLPVPKDKVAFDAFRRFTITVKPEGMSSNL